MNDSVSYPPAQPAQNSPPSVGDSSVQGNILRYAMENHTHASKVRKERISSLADGTILWTYSTPFAAGVVPRIAAIAEVASGITDVVNVQLIDTPTNTSCKLLVNRTNRSTVALLGLTILSVPTQPGITVVHAIAIEP